MKNPLSALAGVIVLLAGLALIWYRTQGGATLTEPLPILVTLGGVAGLLAGGGLLTNAFTQRRRR